MTIFAQRIEALKTAAAEAQLDALAVIPGPNMTYLTGVSFHLSERPTVAIFPVNDKPTIVVPALEESKAAKSEVGFDILTYDDAQGPTAAYERVRKQLGVDQYRLGVEGRRMRFLEIQLLGTATLEAADAVFAHLRMRKSEQELGAMRRAVEIAQNALQQTLPRVTPGVQETEIAAELTLQVLRAGSEPELPFSPIVAAGENGALPHASPGARALEAGQLVTIDWGACFGGYFSDITRTFAVSERPSNARLEAAYEAVRAGNEAARATVRPGATGQDVDRAARRVISEAGFGEYFTHRTGHGLGLECHEEPDMNEGSLVPLAPGMTFTIEPGVYIPGLGGIRIEDDMVVTEDGGESLTTLPRDLITT